MKKNYQEKQNQLNDLRKLLLLVSKQNDEETEKINQEIEEMEKYIESYKGALKVANNGSLDICGTYWKVYCN